MGLKAVLVIGDGMADRPVKRLGWKTPLETARKPYLNHLAQKGICGIIDPLSPGIPPGSDAATLALLGYDASKVYSGRGALEAVGSGMKVLPGDVCFRCNFATVNDDLVVTDRRAGRIESEDAARLAESLQKIELKKSFGVDFVFKNTLQHRAVLIIRGAKLSKAISDSDPEQTGKKVLTVKPLDSTPEAELTAKIANELTDKFSEVLKGHPLNRERVKRKLPQANIILCRGAGTVPNVQPLSQKFGVEAACIGAAPLIRGICKIVGMEILDVKGATGTLQTDYLGKAKAAVQALKRCDFVLLHVKAPDIASHDGDAEQKIRAIEKIDGVVGHLLDNVDLDSTYLAVTADHTTSLATGNHEGDPVPAVIAGPYVRRDGVAVFDERSCAKGGLNRIRGLDLMPILMNFLGRVDKFGA